MKTLSPRGYFAQLLLFNCIKQVYLTVIYTRTKHDSCELLPDGDKVVGFVTKPTTLSPSGSIFLLYYFT